LLRVGLFNFIRRSAEVSVGSVRVSKYSEFIRNLVVPTNLNLVHMKPLRGTALMVFDPGLVFLLVDNLFGGDGRFHTRVEGRDFTQTEQRIILRILDIVFEAYTKSWEPVFPVEFEYIRSEMHTKFANISSGNDTVVVSSFNIELGSSGGKLNVCLPYYMLEPIRDLLTRPLQQAASDSIDQRWTQQLTREVRSAEVELAAEFAQIETSIAELLHLAVGDVLPIDVQPTVIARVGGVPVLECSYGTFNGRYALRVRNTLATPADPDQLIARKSK
jgi:flagellar motor switch protein FliM